MKRFYRITIFILIFVMLVTPMSVFATGSDDPVSTVDAVLSGNADKGKNSAESSQNKEGAKKPGKTTTTTSHPVGDPLTDSKSSLWSTKKNREVLPKKGGLKGKTLKDFAENPHKYTDRYRIISGAMITDVDAVIPYQVSNICFNISKSLCEWSVLATYYSSQGAFNILENNKYNKNLWSRYSKFFSVKSKNFNLILGFITIFIGLFALLMLLQGRISEGFGRLGACILIFVIAILVYGNATDVMKSSIGIAKGISTSLEAAFNMAGAGSADGKDKGETNLTYALIMDNMVVKPYNHLQYGSYDPIKKGEVMSKMQTMYNYFLTYTDDDRANCWFADKNGAKQNNAIYGENAGTKEISQAAHKAVAAKLSNEEQVLRKLGDFFNGDATYYDGVYTAFCEAYGEKTTKLTNLDADRDNGTNSNIITHINVGKKEYPFVKIYGTEGWFGKMGEAFLNLVLSIILFVVYGIIAFITFAGQIMVLFAMMFGLPICIYGMFKGFEPVKKLIIVFVGGFACCVMSGIMRGMFSSFMSVFQDIAGDNLVYQLFLVIVLLFVGGKIVKKFISAASEGNADGARMALMRARMAETRARMTGHAGGRLLHKAEHAGKEGIKTAKNAGALGTWLARGGANPNNNEDSGIKKEERPEAGDKSENNENEDKSKLNDKEETNDEDLKNKNIDEEKEKESLKDQENEDDGIAKRASANEEHHKDDIKDTPEDIAKEKGPNNANTDGKEQKEKPQKVSEIDKANKEDNANLQGAEKTDTQKEVDKAINENERAANKDNEIDDKSVIDKLGGAIQPKEQPQKQNESPFTLKETLPKN